MRKPVVIIALLLLATPASACPFLDEIKGECAPLAMSDKCAAMPDMRADPVCNALGHYSSNNYTAYVDGRLVPISDATRRHDYPQPYGGGMARPHDATPEGLAR